MMMHAMSANVGFFADGKFSSLPSEIISYHSLSHNIAGVCVDNKVYLVGGQFRSDRAEPHFQGIWISETKPRSLDKFVHISKPRLLLRGDEKGCIEGRSGFGGCEFDGRFSIIHFRNRFILFARANAGPCPVGCGRNVQMTNSSDLENWSDFELLRFKDTNHLNIYFVMATVIDSELIAGYFPGILGLHRNCVSDGCETRSSGIFVSWSKDGLHWEEPRNVYEQAPESNRVVIHPVGMFRNRLVTMEPTDINVAFKLSQELSDFNASLTLHTLGNFDVKQTTLTSEGGGDYDMEAWND